MRGRITCSSSLTWAPSSPRRSSSLTEPAVRLLSIGEEPEKGNQLTLEAYALLEGTEIGFAGNAESRDLLEGTCRRRRLRRLYRQHRAEAARGDDQVDSRRAPGRGPRRRPRGKVGAFLIRPAARRLRTRFDPDTYGGAYLLGLRGLSVIAHGNSSRAAIANAIRLAARGVEHDVVGRLASRLPDRRSPAAV